LSCSFYLYRFRKYVSHGFPIINFCNPGVQYEKPCIVKPTRCTNVSNLFYFGITLYIIYNIFIYCNWFVNRGYMRSMFGQSFRPSSGVQDLTYSNRNCCLIASENPLAIRQQYLFDKCLLLYVQSSNS